MTFVKRSRTAVLIAFYNNTDTIERVLESLTRSTIPVDVIVIDDASPIPARQFTDQFIDRLNLTVLLRNENGGVTQALNHGVTYALENKYDYIAVNDADDYSHPNRFKKEIAFLDAHANVGVVGAWAQAISETDDRPLYRFCYPEDNRSLQNFLWRNNPMVHSTVIYRATALQQLGSFDPSMNGSQDYELIFRISREFELANLPEVLLDYTIREQSFSVKNRREQVWKRIRIQWRYFEALRWSAWVGLLRSFIMLPVPTGLLNSVKSVTRTNG